MGEGLTRGREGGGRESSTSSAALGLMLKGGVVEAGDQIYNVDDIVAGDNVENEYQHNQISGK